MYALKKFFVSIYLFVYLFNSICQNILSQTHFHRYVLKVNSYSSFKNKVL